MTVLLSDSEVLPQDLLVAEVGLTGVEAIMPLKVQYPQVTKFGFAYG